MWCWIGWQFQILDFCCIWLQDTHWGPSFFQRERIEGTIDIFACCIVSVFSPLMHIKQLVSMPVPSCYRGNLAHTCLHCHPTWRILIFSSFSVKAEKGLAYQLSKAVDGTNYQLIFFSLRFPSILSPFLMLHMPLLKQQILFIYPTVPVYCPLQQLCHAWKPKGLPCLHSYTPLKFCASICIKQWGSWFCHPSPGAVKKKNKKSKTF